jgi:hypothetical protein
MNEIKYSLYIVEYNSDFPGLLHNYKTYIGQGWRLDIDFLGTESDNDNRALWGTICIRC